MRRHLCAQGHKVNIKLVRRVLSWRLSNTMETDFCIEALNEAIHRFGAPKIFNTDQAVNSHFGNGLIGLSLPTSKYRWMAKVGIWTIYLSNGCGDHSNMNVFICMLGVVAQKPENELASEPTSIIRNVLIKLIVV